MSEIKNENKVKDKTFFKIFRIKGNLSKISFLKGNFQKITFLKDIFLEFRF